MKGPFVLEELLKELDRAPRGSGPVSEARRDERLAAMKRLQRSVVRERRALSSRARWIVAAAALALAVAIAAVGILRSTAPIADQAAESVRLRAVAGIVEVRRSGHRDIVGADTRLLAPGETVETGAGAVASLFLPSGATFSMTERARLQVERRAPAHEGVRLAMGRIDVHVPKLPSGGTFVVESTDATVTVRGTRFAVVVEGAPRPVTRVEVSEGVVAVASRGKTVELRSGDRWSSAEAPDEVAPEATALPGRGTEASLPSPALPAAGASNSTNAGRPRSTLGNENELLSQAMAASAAGDDAGALSLLGAFLSKHPRSPLAENASVERLRVLARTGNRAAAARSARAYLARYPEGMGKDLARRLATEGTDAPGPSRPR